MNRVKFGERSARNGGANPEPRRIMSLISEEELRKAINNNALDNLELLCPNCHTFTDTYKSKNRKV